MSNSSVLSILDMPNEILVKIILYLYPRERLAMGKSCKKFNDLVFGDDIDISLVTVILSPTVTSQPSKKPRYTSNLVHRSVHKLRNFSSVSCHIMSNSSVCGILDMPDKILVKIIMHFDARERLALGKSCQRFYDLVFGDEELLRNLDFTTSWLRTSKSVIQQYFKDKKTYKKILGLNVQQVWSVRKLGSSIRKATNLVELNILGAGLRFESIEELPRFLKPLVHLKRLSVSWPYPYVQPMVDYPEWNQALKEPFSRLTYLSLVMDQFTNDLLFILQFCQRLEELRLMASTGEISYLESPSRPGPMKLTNLKFVRLINGEGSGVIRGHNIMSIVPDPAEWTDFHQAHPHHAIYLEKNLEVCAELGQVKDMPPPAHIASFRNAGSIDKGWPLVPEHLLSEVIRVNHEDAPEKFCCLDSSRYAYFGPNLMRIDDAKKLLKDPGHQISYLHLSHVIERNCDVHLLASAFPNLTKLVFFGISNRNSMSVSDMKKPLRRRLRRKGSLASEEDSDARNTSSSFKMLVENTPHLKVLEICSGFQGYYVECWDLDALYLISGWKNLTVIRLSDIPITDGKFLIDIGRECEKLEEVTLHHLSRFNINFSYESELLQMLQHCKNLRELSIQGMSLKHLSDMLNILSNCPRLAALCLPYVDKESDPLKLTSSLQEMLRQCRELKLFWIALEYHRFFRRLERDIKRMIIELNRSNFQLNLRASYSYQTDIRDVFFSKPV